MPRTENAPALTRRRRRRLGVVLSILATVFVLELTARIYLSLTSSATVASPSRVIHDFYPELKLADKLAPTGTPATFDILILGGSALNAAFVDIGDLLIERLQGQLSVPVRVCSMAMTGHTTRDSFIKHRMLRKNPFHVVVVYHGINDVRLNNAPAAVFDPEYSHSRFYERVNALCRHRPFMDLLVLPYIIDELAGRLKFRRFPERYVPPDWPRPEWVAHGSVIRSAPSFRANLDGIIADSKCRHETVVLATFAAYLAPGYSRERFQAKQLDYVDHLYPVELWGRTPNVVAALDTHNHAVRAAAPKHTHVRLLDLERRIPKKGCFYDDICHLSDDGYAVLADALADALMQVSREQPRR
jgi:hypothetical protein